MRVLIPLLIIACGLVSTVLALRSHRMPAATAGVRWSSRTSILISLGLVIGQIPAPLSRDSTPIRVIAMVASTLLLIPAFVCIRHTQRANAAAMKQIREDAAKMRAAGR